MILIMMRTITRAGEMPSAIDLSLYILSSIFTIVYLNCRFDLPFNLTPPPGPWVYIVEARILQTFR